MTNEVQKVEDQVDRKTMVDVLRSSLYPGAREESVALVLNYCRAAKLDPMMKPVHIVPMLVPTGKKDAKGWDIKEYRDVIMPGIGLYRTQAARTGTLVGISEPEFGPDHTEKIGTMEITYPVSCRVTVEKMVGGIVAKFTAVERWTENYASKSRDDPTPNAMWAKRRYGQLGKCTQAQALRMAFPDSTGDQSTAEEMAGKEYDGTVLGSPMLGQQAEEVAEKETSDQKPTGGQTIEGTATKVEPEPAKQLPLYDAAKFTQNLPAWLELIWSGKKSADYLLKMLGTRAALTAEQIAAIRAPKPVVATADGSIEGLRKTVTDDASKAHIGIAEVEAFMGCAFGEASKELLHEALAYINDPDGRQA